MTHLDGLGTSAKIIGAVNTIARDGDLLIGENIDGRGFVAALREVVNPKGKSVVLFGAGGAARAVAVEMALAGAATITVVNRSGARGQAVVDLLNDSTETRANHAPWKDTFTVAGTSFRMTAEHMLDLMAIMQRTIANF